MLDLYKTIDAIIDAYNVELPDLYKRRDPKEPNRAAKEKAEDEFYKAMRARWRAQAKQIKERLTRMLPHKNVDDWLRLLDDSFKDDESRKRLLILFTAMFSDGIDFFAMNTRIGIDWTQAKLEVLDYVDKSHEEWIESIDSATRDALKRELENFVREDGYTIGDIMSGLQKVGMSESRAMRVAVTEVTRSYGQAEQAGAEALAKEYPDAKVIKTWYTNNDGLVCEICRPLHKLKVEYNKEFAPGIMHPAAHPNCRCWMAHDVEFPDG